MGNNRAITGNFRCDTMSASATYNEVVCSVLQRTYGVRKRGERMLARDAMSTPRACRNWLTGANAPSGEALINLLANCDELADEINRLVAERRAARGQK